MNPELPGVLLREGLSLMAVVGGPLFAAMLAAGLLLGVLQAATQINDPAIGFLPKLAVGILICVAMGGWMTERLAAYLAQSIERMGAPPF